MIAASPQSSVAAGFLKQPVPYDQIIDMQFVTSANAGN
jgi:hypothetical protein